MPLVVQNTPRTDLALVDALGEAGTATVHEAQGRTGLLRTAAPDLPPGPGRRQRTDLHGRARRQLDDPRRRRAGAAGRPARRDPDERVRRRLRRRPAGREPARARRPGLVIDAGVRDVATLTEMGFPVWAKAICAQGTVKETPGDCQVPIVIAGVLRAPGRRDRGRRRRRRLVPREDAGAVLKKAGRARRTRPPSGPGWPPASSASTSTPCGSAWPRRACATSTTRRAGDADRRAVRRHARRHVEGTRVLRDDLPTDRAVRDAVLLAAMGSPDPREIDGLGGAHPLTSKVAVVESTRDDADVDYLFLQVWPDRPEVSDSQNCGNMLAAVGPFAIEHGLVAAAGRVTPVRIWMENTDTLATALRPDAGRRGALRRRRPHRRRARVARPDPARVRRHRRIVVRCAAAHRQRRRRDRGHAVTCIDNGMPVVCLAAADFGLPGGESPAEIEGNAGREAAHRGGAPRRRAADEPR